MIESDADRLAYVQTFGEPATVNGREVIGVFDNEYAEATPGQEALDSATCRLECRSVDVPDVKTRSPVSVAGRSFAVLSVQPDGTGMTVLILGEP